MSQAMTAARRFIGIDLGAETIKVVELCEDDGRLAWARCELIEHDKAPGPRLLELLARWDWHDVYAAVTGRFGRLLQLPRVPLKQAQACGFGYLVDEEAATIVSIGGHGYSVLERRAGGVEVLRENSRCSQGTGNFLRQLVARFGLTVQEASDLCARVETPAPLSGRCPVILKTDMTHLANKGECRASILAGLYDAVCQNVQVLLKPGLSPARLLLTGGVSRAPRIRENFRRFADQHGMSLLPLPVEDALFIEALGCALTAYEQLQPAVPLAALLLPPQAAHLDRVPPLKTYLHQVKRMAAPKAVPTVPSATPHALVLGLDIGSTGSKVVALDAATRQPLWEDYIGTQGDPVAAVQSLVRGFLRSDVGKTAVVGFGVTGSGREIVGSLLATCFGAAHVYVLNEIAAHAEGARFYDERVDTIFEIGGQDAKYIRLAEGRVIDAAMNEACSAGTGSFIEEQGRKLAGIRDVAHLGEEALAAPFGVSLGQHCSVFMAEIIDEAVAAGSDTRAIVAGIYDAIVQNYLNRVKGSRSVGQVIFCQGMPFSADALAAAVARQTGATVIVPPNPGTVGALGIGRLAAKEGAGASAAVVDLQRVLQASVKAKDTFVCKSKQGCGGTGNHCRIERLTTVIATQTQRFTWGGGCSLWDQGVARVKLPAQAPDPFRQRQAWVDACIADLVPRGQGRRVALTDGFQLRGLFPFFATYLTALGLRIVPSRRADQNTLKEGIAAANIPFCAPMQLYHGLVGQMAESGADFLFLPMVRQLPRQADEGRAVVCPIVQGSSDITRWDLRRQIRAQVVSPVIDFDQGNYRSAAFRESCRRTALALGVTDARWELAAHTAAETQTAFEEACVNFGDQALAFCDREGVTPVVVLGRPYTIHNTVLNANVPALLREQGAIAIPVDCYRVSDATPVFEDIFWGFGQRNTRAAHQIRRTDGLYSVFCSNYACGPDSFNLHLYTYVMEGKPLAIIETDGHSGDAGTKTRIEAFLHCVREERASAQMSGGRPKTAVSPPRELRTIEQDKRRLAQIRKHGECVLVPRMGPGAEALAACLRGIGVAAEALAQPTRETVHLGRRYTSGKECVPMCLTIGSVLERIEQDRQGSRRFAVFMPTAGGPCRFGMYNVLHKIILERLGWKDRVRVWSPPDNDYFENLPAGFAALAFTGLVAADVLFDALCAVRPAERHPGAAAALYAQLQRELSATLEAAGQGDLSVPAALMQLVNGRLFGCAELLRRAGAEFAALKEERALPQVAIVGEIYVRLDPFANDFVVEKLEAHGIRTRVAPLGEWLEYTDHVAHRQGLKRGFGAQISRFVQRRIQGRVYALVGDALGWPPRTQVRDALLAAAPYIRPELTGEAVLTVGGPLHEWRAGQIDGVVSVGPLECMPNKIAEAQFFHIAEQEGLASLTLALNGDPVDPEIVDNFAFEVLARFKRRHATVTQPAPLWVREAG